MRFIALALVLLMVFGGSVSAQPRTNASPVITYVNNITTYDNITFSYTTRDLIVENYDSDNYVYVDVKSDSNTADTSRCFLLGPGESLALYDFLTDGVSILHDNLYSPSEEASPIAVIAVY